jgi:hypothetical protein
MQIPSQYYHKDIRSLVDKFHCEHCQRKKLSGTSYGLLPERKLRPVPFEECAVDLIGPWIFQVRNKPYEFNALTVKDTVSNLVELVRIDEKTLAQVARKYAQIWLSRYPWPERCVHNIGGEFVGDQSSNFFSKNAGLKMPQHQVKIHKPMQSANGCIKNILQTLLHGEPQQDMTKAKDFIDEALSIGTHAMQTGIHTTLGSSPGNLVFNRDMFLNILLIADWHAITRKHEHLINENLMHENW